MRYTQTLTTGLEYAEDTTTIEGLIFIRIGRVAYVIMNHSYTVTENQNNSIGHVPSGFVPQTDVYFWVATSESSPKLTEIRITTGGNVTINGWMVSGTVLLHGSMTYIAKKSS